MAAFVLIAVSIGVDLYQVTVRCLKSGFSIPNIISVLQELHDEVRSSKYLECIEEIYENQSHSEFHSLGIACFNCRRKFIRVKMNCNQVEYGLEVDGAEEAFEILDVSKRLIFIAQNVDTHSKIIHGN